VPFQAISSYVPVCALIHYCFLEIVFAIQDDDEYDDLLYRDARQYVFHAMLLHVMNDHGCQRIHKP